MNEPIQYKSAKQRRRLFKRLRGDEFEVLTDDQKMAYAVDYLSVYRCLSPIVARWLIEQLATERDFNI